MIRRDRSGGRRRSGSVLVMFALALTTILGASGLSFDMARMYLAREEGQSFADAAALAAATQLNGFPSGIALAKASAVESWKMHNFGTDDYNRAADNSGDIQVTFCTDPLCTSSAESPDPATGYRFARVNVRSSVPLFLLPLVMGRFHTNVVSEAIAGQVRPTAWTEGLFPYGVYERELPFESNPDETSDFGLFTDLQYTFSWSPTADQYLMQAFNLHAVNNATNTRWTASDLLAATLGTEAYQDLIHIGEYLRVDVGTGPAWCSGDTSQNFLKTLIRQNPTAFEPVPDTSLSSTYSGITTAQVLRDKGSYRATGAPPAEGVSVSEGYQGGVVYTKNQSISMLREPRSAAVQSAIIALTRQDANQSESTNGYGFGSSRDYFSATPIGTGERLVTIPVLDRQGMATESSTVRGFRAFLLMVDDCPGCTVTNKYYDTVATPPRDNWCATFLGDALEPMGRETAGMNGVYTVRLIR